MTLIIVLTEIPGMPLLEFVNENLIIHWLREPTTDDTPDLFVIVEGKR